MQCRCTRCDHEWDEKVYFNYRKCPQCKVRIDTTNTAHPNWKRFHGQATPPPQAVSPKPNAAPAAPKPGTLPPLINTKGGLGQIPEQDHSYLNSEDKFRLRHRGGRKIIFPI